MLLYLLLSLPLLAVSSPNVSPRVTLLQSQSCAYSPYNKQLQCTCQREDSVAYLDLHLSYYIKMAQQIHQVLIKNCDDLVVSLNLEEMNPTNIPVRFKYCKNIQIDTIRFQTPHVGRQKLDIKFYNVDTFTFMGLHVDEALTVEADNVKEARFLQSTFNHIPKNGISIKNAKMLEISDSIFLRIAPESIVVEKTKEVKITNNEFSINAIKAVYAKGGSLLYISCNRLLGDSISPECVTTTTTTTTTTTSTTTITTTTTTTPRTTQMIIPHESSLESSLSLELVIGMISGVLSFLLILVACVFWFCCRKKQPVKEDSEDGTAELMVSEEGNAIMESPVKAASDPEPLVANPGELESLLGEEPEVEMRSVSPAGPKFESPCFLEEIKRNKIFNKQKSIISEMGEAKKAEVPQRNGGVELVKDIEEIETEVEPSKSEEPPVKKVEDKSDKVMESSRTESDEDFHNDNNKKETIDKDIDELQSLLKKAYEQEQALRNGE